jgi:hypothetical protein
VTTTFNNIKFTDSSFDAKKTVIDLHSDSPNFELKLMNCGLGLAFDYHVLTNPELVDDKGTGRAWLKNLNISVLASPSVENSFFQIDFQEIQLDIEDFGLDLQGQDLATIIDYFSDTLKEFIRQYLLGKLNERTKQSIEDMLNGLLMNAPRDFVIDKDQLVIDYFLVNEGFVVTDNYFSTIHDGTFHRRGHEVPADKKAYTNMPVHVAEAGEI